MMGVSFAHAAEENVTSAAFAVSEVKVVNQNTLDVSFNNDVFEDASVFEFKLTSKLDDTHEIALTGATLSAPNTIEVTTLESFLPNTEYNFVVLFASDKEGNVIQNGVDGMASFTTPADFAVADVTTTVETVVPQDEVLNAAPEETSTDLNAAPTSETLSGETQEVTAVAETAEALPETGPKEMLFVLLALLLGAGAVYMRRKA